MQDLQGPFAGKEGLSKRAFGSTKLLSDDLIGQSSRFVGKRGCRGSPAGRDRITGSELASLVEVPHAEHVLVAVELKREPSPRSQAVESLPFRMEWTTQL